MKPSRIAHGVRADGAHPQRHATGSGAFRTILRSVANRSWKFPGSGEQGSALVEMAVTLPLLMFIMTGVFSFSIALYQKQLLVQGVSSGARTLALQRDQSDPCTTAAGSIYTATPGLVKSNLTLTFIVDGTNYGTGTTSCPGAGSSMASGHTVQVYATYPCLLQVANLWRTGNPFSGCSMSASVAEVIQ